MFDPVPTAPAAIIPVFPPPRSTTVPPALEFPADCAALGLDCPTQCFTLTTSIIQTNRSFILDSCMEIDYFTTTIQLPFKIN